MKKENGDPASGKICTSFNISQRSWSS